MERYVCIHGHFYQPPRENPWLEAVEIQDSAAPYHDWNERIAAECYGPNGASRILDPEGRIVDIVNNYSRISFDFGPTLLSWMERHQPEIYASVLEADLLSRRNFSGHGSAMAQVYNHMIMPLADSRDKRTQVVWGLKDFERRFGRQAEGMWMAETAVDVETLDIMSEFGVKFTIVAPNQVRRTRPIGGGGWEDVSGGRIDPTRAYLANLPSGRSIAVFVYDGPISNSVAFEGVLSRGEELEKRLVGAFSDTRNWPQIVHIATDGETFGHHHRFGDMALAYAVSRIWNKGSVRMTNYGEYLEKHPPLMEIEVFENSSWSCIHGVERWRADCGCNSGMQRGWKQEWRGPLRRAMDWLRDGPVARCRQGAPVTGAAFDSLRNGYVEVLSDRSHETISALLSRHGLAAVGDESRNRLVKLLEIERNAMLMYTSCGWFFDDISGIETVQIIAYAARVVALAEDLLGAPVEKDFVARLAESRGNTPEHPDGRSVYEKLVKPSMVGLRRVAAHAAISSLFEDYEPEGELYGFRIDRRDDRAWEVGRARLATGKMHVSSLITRESELLSFGVLHFGDHHVNGGVRPFQGEEAFSIMVEEVSNAFLGGDLAETLRVLDRHFIELNYSLKSLFRDPQRRILRKVMSSFTEETDAGYRQAYERQAPMLRFLAELGVPVPRNLKTVAEIVLTSTLRSALEEDDMDRVEALLSEAGEVSVDLNHEVLKHAFRRKYEEAVHAFAADPEDAQALARMKRLSTLLPAFPFHLDLWRVQNTVFRMLKQLYPAKRSAAGQGDEAASEWADKFASIATHLKMQVE